MTDAEPPAPRPSGLAPAFYAQHRGTRWGDWWTLLHPPYTAWHLSYVVVGACLLAPVDVGRLLATLLAFFLAVGVAAHALDELHGRPLGTRIPDWALVAASAGGLFGAVALGIAGAVRFNAWLAVFVVVGLVLAVAYNLELFGGRLHSDAVFAASWGAFPLLTAYFAQHGTLSVAAAVAAVFAFFFSAAQRQLSTPARRLRRRTSDVEGSITDAGGAVTPISATTILSPLERALRSLSWAAVALAVALALSATRHVG